MKLNKIKKDDFFKRSLTAKTVYIRGDYVREIKKYLCIDAEDMNREIFLKGNTEVTQDFEY